MAVEFITTYAISANPANGEEYLIKHYVITANHCATVAVALYRQVAYGLIQVIILSNL
jgi:hypothetical protein